MIRISLLVVSLAGALLPGQALAAEMNYDAELEALTSRVIETEIEVETARMNVLERRGFIGAAEARVRFENAVYYFLVREYERAAYEFFTLVESGSLQEDFLRLDAEWYLAECLFEMGNASLAEEAYQAIIDEGNSHPFFRDGVRRLMELYSLRDDTEGFNRLYNEFIVTGRVPTSDVVRYTLGKSFYRRGEHGRALDALSQVSGEGAWFGRARYLMGTIYVLRDDYDAASQEFDYASGISRETTDDRDVADLANLAVARLAYERGDFLGAATRYQRIGRESSYFADALYEICWTFIKDGDYQQALQAVEIFLLAFPEHRYASQLRLLQGKLHMKEIEYEAALGSFEDVLGNYSEVYGALDDLSSSTETAARWFERLIELDISPNEILDGTGLSTYELRAHEIPGPRGEPLPRYAVEMLVATQEMDRTFNISRELAHQGSEVTGAEELIVELEAALAEGDDTLGTFRSAAVILDRYAGESMSMLTDLLLIEESWMLNRAEGDAQSALRGLQGQREQITNEISELRGDPSTGSAAASGAEGAEMLRRLQDLKGRYDVNWASISSAGRGGAVEEIRGGVDQIWGRTTGVLDMVQGVRAQLSSREAKELARVRSKLSAENTNVGSARRELDGFDTEMSRLSGEIARAGFQDLADHFEETLLQADIGVVDVYWLRKVAVTDEREEVQKDREVLLRELNDRFRIIRQGLED